MAQQIRFVDSPIGRLLLSADDSGCLTGLRLENHCPSSLSAALSGSPSGSGWVESGSNGVLDKIASQLDEYFEGSRVEFDIPLAPRGTPFQRQVWDVLLGVPYGSTVSYGEVATKLGRPGAARAVGQANHSNPIAVVIPCHRVIGARGELGGYAGGVERKRSLLDLEGRRTVHR